MITTGEEIFLWEELRDKILSLLDDVDDSRSQVKDKWDDPTPEFDCLEHMLADACDYVEGRIQELYPQYSEYKAYTKVEKQQAQEALQNNINFVALRKLCNSNEIQKAMIYIVSNDEASMKYDDTRKAINEFRNFELQLKG